MEQEESKTTQKVRESIVKAAEAGENLSRRISEITRKAVKEAIEKHGPDIKKVEQVSREVATGFIKAVNESGLKMLGLFNEAIAGISQGAESLGDKASAAAKSAAEKTIGVIRDTKDRAGELARDAAKGVMQGIKEVSEREAPKK
ncbi:hypothetical protein ACFL5V_07100 [Fibrobacterota bacterium]